MADTTGKSIAGLHGGLDCHGVRSKVQCSYRCGNAAMRTWQGRNILPIDYACWIYRPATWRHQGHNNIYEMG